MRHRHQVVEIESTTSPPLRDVLIAGDDETIELIDESRPPDPILPEPMGHAPAPRRSTVSALPTSRPISPHRPNLPWGLGTDGWPRHNSRLVRLFACDPEELLAGAVGRTWAAMTLDHEVRPVAGEPWPLAVAGWLQMPYPSRALSVELRAQPFHDRYCRVDVVLCSRRRWPRRFFDEASLCLTQMHLLERDGTRV
jgi:hypothetical protein